MPRALRSHTLEICVRKQARAEDVSVVAALDPARCDARYSPKKAPGFHTKASVNFSTWQKKEIAGTISSHCQIRLISLLRVFYLNLEEICDTMSSLLVHTLLRQMVYSR